MLSPTTMMRMVGRGSAMPLALMQTAAAVVMVGLLLGPTLVKSAPPPTCAFTMAGAFIPLTSVPASSASSLCAQYTQSGQTAQLGPAQVSASPGFAVATQYTDLWGMCSVFYTITSQNVWITPGTSFFPTLCNALTPYTGGTLRLFTCSLDQYVLCQFPTITTDTTTTTTFTLTTQVTETSATATDLSTLVLNASSTQTKTVTSVATVLTGTTLLVTQTLTNTIAETSTTVTTVTETDNTDTVVTLLSTLTVSAGSTTTVTQTRWSTISAVTSTSTLLTVTEVTCPPAFP